MSAPLQRYTKQKYEHLKFYYTCWAFKSKSDGQADDVNSHACHSFINCKRERVWLSWVPGCLKKSHLKDQENQWFCACEIPELLDPPRGDATSEPLVDCFMIDAAVGSSALVTSIARPPDAWARSLYSWASSAAIILDCCSSLLLRRLVSDESVIIKFTWESKNKTKFWIIFRILHLQALFLCLKLIDGLLMLNIMNRDFTVCPKL